MQTLERFDTRYYKRSYANNFTFFDGFTADDLANMLMERKFHLSLQNKYAKKKYEFRNSYYGRFRRDLCFYWLIMFLSQVHMII